MTVASEVAEIEYSGNGVTTAFSVPYYFLDQGDLVVILTDSDGATSTQTLTTDYTVTGAGVPAGGTVTMVAAPATGETLTILRDPAIVQETDYIANDSFPAETHEEALDRLTMIAQRQSARIGRALRVPDGDPVSDLELPTQASRLGQFLRFDDLNGEPEMASFDGNGTVLSRSVIGGYLFPRTAEEVAAGVTPADYSIPSHDAVGELMLARYGLAEGASGAVNRAAFEDAIDVAGQLGGGVLRAPAGTFAIDATVTIDESYVFIKGSVASATIWQFDPAGTDVLFHFTKGASIIYFCGIGNCKFYSANSQVKTAVLAEDCNNFTAEYLVISTGGWAGTGSTGLYIKGRDAANIHRNLINCERPLVIGVNPNYATLHCDHFRIQNNEFGCLVSTGKCIEFEEGVNLTSHWISNNAFTQGNYAIYASNTTNAAAWYGCNWTNNRYEQAANTTGYGIYAYNSAGQIQLVQIEDWYIGPDTGLNVTHGGILVGPSGNVQRVRIRNVDYVGTGEALNVPFSSSLTDVHWTGCKWRVGCTMTLTNGVAQYEGTYNAAQMQFPHEAQYVYNGGALISRAVQRFDGMKVFHYEATVADDGQLNLPCTAALGVEAAMFRAVAVTGSTIAYAHGGWIPGTAPDVYGTASLVSNTSVDGDLCVIDSSNGLSVINRLGGEASIAIVVEMVD